jgi:hypothetical protein
MKELLTADTKDTQQRLGTLRDGIDRAPFKSADPFTDYMQARTAETFAALAFGGSFRGVSWPKRKSAREKDRGRPLLVDSGRLKAEAISAAARVDSNGLEYSTGLSYARAVAASRPFLFFEARVDAQKLSQIVLAGCELDGEDKPWP